MTTEERILRLNVPKWATIIEVHFWEEDTGGAWKKVDYRVEDLERAPRPEKEIREYLKTLKWRKRRVVYFCFPYLENDEKVLRGVLCVDKQEGDEG